MSPAFQGIISRGLLILPNAKDPKHCPSWKTGRGSVTWAGALGGFRVCSFFSSRSMFPPNDPCNYPSSSTPKATILSKSTRAPLLASLKPSTLADDPPTPGPSKLTPPRTQPTKKKAAVIECICIDSSDEDDEPGVAVDQERWTPERDDPNSGVLF